MNSGDVDLDFIAATPGSNGFADVTAIVIDPTTNKFNLIGSAPVYETPMIPVKSFIEVSNNNGSIQVDVSIFSDKATNLLRKNIHLFGELVGAKYYFEQGVKISDDDYQELLDEDINLIEIDAINTAFNFKTQTIIDMLLNKPVAVSSSDIADNLLSEIFGDSFKVKNDPLDETMNVLEDGTFNALSDEINYSNVVTPFETDTSENFNIFESIMSSAELSAAMSDSEGEVEIVDTSKSSDSKDITNFLNQDIVAKQIQIIYDSLYISSAKESIDYEDSLDVALTFISKHNPNNLPNDCLELMSNVVTEFLSDVDLNSLLSEFKFLLLVDKNSLISLLESDTTYLDRIYNGDLRKEISVKEFLIKQFDKFFEQYTRMHKHYKLEGKLTPEKVIYIFSIMFQLFHYVNKNRIKFTNEFESKTSYLEDIQLKYNQAITENINVPPELLLSNYNTQLLEGEQEIIQISTKLLTQVKDLFNRNLR